MARSHALRALVLLTVAAAACGGADDGGTKSPSSVTTADLYGFWTGPENLDDAGAPLPDTAWLTVQFRDVDPYYAELVGLTDVYYVYKGGRLVEAGTFAVGGGSLHLVPIARDGLGNQPAYDREITRFAPTSGMTFGGRKYEYSQVCPPRAFSWPLPNGTRAANIDSTYTGADWDTVGGLALGFDARGDLYGVLGLVGHGWGTPIFSTTYGSCEMRPQAFPNGQSGDLAVAPDGGVHVVFVPFDGSFSTGRVTYGYRPPGAPDGLAGWTFEDLAPGPEMKHPTLDLTRDGQPVVTYVDDGERVIRRRDAAGAWATTQIAAEVPEGATVVDADGRLHVLVREFDEAQVARLHVYSEGDDAWSLTTVAPPAGESIAVLTEATVDADGQWQLFVHTKDPEGERPYVRMWRGAGALDAPTWSSTLMESPTALTTTADGTLLMLGRDAFGRVLPDGREEVSAWPKETFISNELTRPDALTAGPGGMMAFGDAGLFYMRPPDALYAPHMVTVEVSIVGDGRGEVRFGDSVCDGDCTYSWPAYARFPLVYAPDPATSVLVAGPTEAGRPCEQPADGCVYQVPPPQPLDAPTPQRIEYRWAHLGAVVDVADNLENAVAPGRIAAGGGRLAVAFGVGNTTTLVRTMGEDDAAVVWERRAEGAPALGLAVGSAGEVYLATDASGSFEGRGAAPAAGASGLMLARLGAAAGAVEWATVLSGTAAGPGAAGGPKVGGVVAVGGGVVVAFTLSEAADLGGGQVLSPEDGGVVMRLDAAGEVDWAVQLGAGAALVAGAGNKLVAAAGGRLATLDPATGAVIDSRELGGQAAFTALAFGPSGSVHATYKGAAVDESGIDYDPETAGLGGYLALASNLATGSGYRNRFFDVGTVVPTSASTGMVVDQIIPQVFPKPETQPFTLGGANVDGAMAPGGVALDSHGSPRFFFRIGGGANFGRGFDTTDYSGGEQHLLVMTWLPPTP
ncbi:MAG: hypothetical protein H6733_18105 [Alphaproteobacteria bacterium]|nr:hypothetical protein [Alphaproteobacteria bacterium]